MAILIIKNLIQRGKPIILSQYLQSVYGSIHKDTEHFKSPFVLINKKNHSFKSIQLLMQFKIHFIFIKFNVSCYR